LWGGRTRRGGRGAPPHPTPFPRSPPQASQRDAELADVAKEAAEQLKGPAERSAEEEELAEIYRARGLSPALAAAVAAELSASDDVVRHHARDELGIDLDALANPVQAAAASAAAFTVGAAVPLLAAAFIAPVVPRLLSLLGASCFTLIALGATGAVLGGAAPVRGAARVLLGGSAAMAITYGVGKLFALTAGGALPAV
jgi:VIT1/CCC1 family predicted Fe2+/Mn2+ transporter